MKKLYLILCLLLIPSICFAGVIASGSVTNANMKISAIDGTSFVDFSAANILTNHTNKEVKIYDSAGKIIQGYIKAVGTGETLGADLVTDGGFAAVTETNSYTSDFSAGVDGWGRNRGTATGNIDGIGGQDNNLRFVTNNEFGTHRLEKLNIFTIGNTYRIKFSYYIPSGQSHIDGLNADSGVNSIVSDLSTTGSWGSVDVYYTAESTSLLIIATDGGATSFQDAGADDLFYIRGVEIDDITFTNWQVTDGEGWAPQATAGVLTGKASKVAGTASNLEQSGTSAEAGKLYKLVQTFERSAGSITPEFGSIDGAARSSAAIFTDYITALDTDYLKFKADATFVGTVDLSSIKQVLTPPATGVTITNTKCGLVYSFTSKDGAFDYSDAADYTYEIVTTGSVVEW